MSFDLMSFNPCLLQKYALQDILKCNSFSAKYGLTLTEAEATALIDTRSYSLKANHRIELGGGIIDQIIMAFCDSPYLLASNYAETLHELVDIFYYYKNQSLELISDEELISFMATTYNGSAQGSLQLLAHRELENLAHHLRYGGALETFFQEEETEDELY